MPRRFGPIAPDRQLQSQFAVFGPDPRLDPSGGFAWISADNHQILRLEIELIQPMPEVRMVAEHIAIEYGTVAFQDGNVRLWLPRSAEHPPIDSSDDDETIVARHLSTCHNRMNCNPSASQTVGVKKVL